MSDELIEVPILILPGLGYRAAEARLKEVFGEEILERAKKMRPLLICVDAPTEEETD